MPPDDERGFLTERDRAYLTDESDIEPKSAHERTVRRAIRQRTRRAFYDFSVVLEHLREDDRERVFDPGPDDETFERGLADTIAFILIGVTDELEFGSGPGYRRGPIASGDHHSHAFEWLLWEGMERGYREFDVLLEELEIRTTDQRMPGLDTVIQRLEAGQDLHPVTASWLLRSGVLDSGRFTEFARDELLEGGEGNE